EFLEVLTVRFRDRKLIAEAEIRSNRHRVLGPAGVMTRVEIGSHKHELIRHRPVPVELGAVKATPVRHAFAYKLITSILGGRVRMREGVPLRKNIENPCGKL